MALAPRLNSLVIPLGHSRHMSFRALIFDSGVGGLSVAAEIAARLPDLAMDYVADDEFRPYGEKTAAQLKARLPELLAVLTDMLSPDVVVMACNTASTTALDEIRSALHVPVVGVVPAIKPAAQITRTGTIAVLGTPGTVAREYVDDLITQFANGKHVLLQGSVNLVDMAEDKLSGRRVNPARIKAELAPLFSGRRGADIDAVVLACTHFPLLKEELKAAVTQTVQWIDSGEAIARRVESLLQTAKPHIRPARDNTAFLIGPQTQQERTSAFARFGFNRVVALKP